MSTKSSPSKRQVALIAGPTASGKSAVALGLAKARNAKKRKTWIINADSMQVYRDIPVLAATPSAAEQKITPHKLFGEWDGATACSAVDWAERAKAEIESAYEADALPVLVGGTGMYMKVLLEGIAPIPDIDPNIRAVVRALPVESAYAALMIEDPERATQLEPGDSQRIARALEVKRSTGTTLAEWQLAKIGGIEGEVELHATVLLPDRDWLYERCDRRFEQMLSEGAIDEIEALVRRDLDPDLPVMRAIGVPEVVAFLRRDISHDQLVEAGAQATRNYAKRQYTWFRRQCPDNWQRISNNPESINSDLDTYFASLLHD